MPKISISSTLTNLETLAQSITPEVKEDVPHLARMHTKLQSLIEEIRKQLSRRDYYQARKQEATRKAQATMRQAKATANFFRKGLIEHYGADNEQLAAFAIQPFRGRKRRKKPEEPE
jgi:thymidine phosphorylase